MKTNTVLRVRRSIQELQDDYTRGSRKPLEDLMRALEGHQGASPRGTPVLLHAGRLSRRAVPWSRVETLLTGAVTVTTATFSWALTRKDFVLDGETIPNPLRSFVLTKNIKDNINGDDPDYSKPRPTTISTPTTTRT